MPEGSNRLKQAFPQSPTVPFRSCEKTNNLSPRRGSSVVVAIGSRLAPDERPSRLFYGSGSEIDLGLMGCEGQGTLQGSPPVSFNRSVRAPHTVAHGQQMRIRCGRAEILQSFKAAATWPASRFKIFECTRSLIQVNRPLRARIGLAAHVTVASNDRNGHARLAHHGQR